MATFTREAIKAALAALLEERPLSGMRDEVLPDLRRITELRQGTLEEMITRSLANNK